MTDFRFEDIVDSTRMIGPDGRYVKSVCKSCSTQRTVMRDDFSRNTVKGSSYVPSSVTIEMLEYVAKMRAWNCCHEGDEPCGDILSGVNAGASRTAGGIFAGLRHGGILSL